MNDFMKWLHRHYIAPHLRRVPAGEYEMYLSLYENEHTGAERAAMAPLFEFVAIHAFLLGARTGAGLAAALEGDQLSQPSAAS